MGLKFSINFQLKNIEFFASEEPHLRIELEVGVCTIFEYLLLMDHRVQLESKVHVIAYFVFILGYIT